MILLPIAERELRVAARRPSTFRVRLGAALTAVVIATGFLILGMMGHWSGGPHLGQALFTLLTWLSLAAALSAGLFFASDALSEEKRAGTMGFLFLTDLRGYDVVVGKLLATSLRGFYAMLGVFPILALTLLMGGVTGSECFGKSLALIVAMVVSLAAGLFVSSLSRDSQTALVATLLLLLALAATGPAADAIVAAAQKRPFRPLLSLPSPVYLFVSASGWGRTPFWWALLANGAVATLLLGLASCLIPHTWQQRAARRTTGANRWARWWKYGGAARRTALRRHLLDLNPILWLACRERWQALSLWVLALVQTGVFVLAFGGDDASARWVLWSPLTLVVPLVLYLAAASQAARLLGEARANGLIELWLSTPLTPRLIAGGQWHALVRLFGLPLGLCLVTLWIGTVLMQQSTWNQLAATKGFPPAARPSATNATTVVATNTPVVITPVGTASGATATIAGFAPLGGWLTFVAPSGSILVILANLTAIAWFGMWMGLTSKSPNRAVLKTLLFVQVIPWFVVSFVSALSVPLVLIPTFLKGGPPPPGFVQWVPLLVAVVSAMLSCAKDLAFFLWARRKLTTKFYARAVQPFGSIRPTASPPPTLQPGTEPPLIPPRAL